MKPSERTFFLAGAMMLAAAIVFAFSLYVHDTHAAPTATAPSAASGSTANAPLPSDGTIIPVMGLVQTISGDKLTMMSNGNTYSIVINTKTRIEQQASQSDATSTKYTDIPLSSVKPGAFILVTSVAPFAQNADITAKSIELVVSH